jgi:ABC-type nickel/cobalt efflux system permease component RcnA
MLLLFFTGIDLIRRYWSRLRRDLLFHAAIAAHPDAPVLHHSTQSSSHHVQIGQRAQHEQGVGILG